ncbi:helix-turn-helix domain-containing protein [Planococcus soli]|uniref:helix-turn-helix domain-containing protein n=1 Tax=Planococcus soli TaxID=2666072 RepID=UPI00115C6BFB|nr:helix-turn-helix transcriptional regulator [Planococcus soli]
MNIQLKSSEETKIMLAKKGESMRSFSMLIGVSHPYLSQIMNKKRNPSARVAYKIAKGLGVKTEDIFLIKVVDVATSKGVAK